ncbi:MAG: formylmethanofuran dehydrogenase subunit C [Pirellulaceae bacterium]|nr:formylmethanofuran dehydrogenase subunit C [Pirellulaceae bacterium]
MALEICTRRPLPLPVDLPRLDEVALHSSSNTVAELQRLPIRLGKDAFEFGQLFECRVVGEQPGLVWSGDTGRLNFVARNLTGGSVRVEGSVGDHAGSEMRGGRLEVTGDAGHWLASDLKGGTIVVSGHCGQYAAASLPARRRGMTGGVLIVRGSAGGGLGRRMRRGIVVVEGDADDPANEMLAGTIILGGQVNGGVGTMMKRGTIVCLQNLGEEQRATLSRGIVYQPLVWRLIQHHLAELKAVVCQRTSGNFQLYHAARHTGSRGEIWEAR